MYFTSLALMFVGMSFYTGVSQTPVNKNTYFLNAQGQYGGNFELHSADYQNSLSSFPTTLNTRTKIFQCDIEGDETHISDDGSTVTTINTLYRGYFSIYATLRPTYYEIEVVSPNYDKVAPSCFVRFNYYDGANELFEFDTPILSSVADYEIYVDEFYFDEWEVDYTDLNFCVDVYCVKTIDYDPTSYSPTGTEYYSGYDDGFDNGYDSGYTDGYQTGESESYQEGYDDGYVTGYNIGKNDGISISQYSFGSLFASISDTPILMIRRLFGFELFGTSLITVFVSLFTALVVLMILKTVWGAKRK